MATPQELLDQHTDKLMSFAESELGHSVMPIEWVNRWVARIIEALASGDREKMLARNVKQELIDTLSDRLTIYLHTAAKRANTEKAKSDLEEALGSAQIDLWVFLEEMERMMTYACRKDDAEKRNVLDIMKGHDIQNGIDDLRRYHEITVRKPELFSAINEDPTALASALWSRHETLRTLKAQVDNAPEMSDQEMLLMHRAYTYLSESLKEICACAKFLYEKDSEELDPYIPEYYRNIGKMGLGIPKSSSEDTE